MALYNIINEIKILIVDDDEWIWDSRCLFFEKESCPLPAIETP